MADSFQQLMQSAQQQLVRMPDGTYAAAPIYGSDTTVPAMYGNTMPATQIPLPRMDTAGPGPGLSGGYSFLQDMLDASTPAPTRTATTTGLPPSLYGDMSSYQDSPSMVARTRDANGNYSAPLRAIDNAVTPANVPKVPLPSWGPSWAEGINAMLPWQPAQVGTGTTGWDGLRSPEENVNGVVRRPGFGPAPTGGGFISLLGGGGAAPAPAAAAAPVVRPIVQVAPTPFAPDSPGGQFEKQYGQGSATNSMLTSSRWQTGY